MSYRNVIINLLLFGISVYLVTGQEPNESGMRIISAQRSGVETEHAFEDGESSAMMGLWNASSIEEFLSLLRTRNGNPVEITDVIRNQTGDDGNIMYISGNSGGRVAQPDGCSPRHTTVRLTFDNSDPNMVYFPTCTKIERCGGCCATRHLECVPSYTERVSYNVFKAAVPHPGSPHLEWQGEYATVILDRHVTCRIQCTLTPNKCGPKKEFLERQCECRCRVYERCQPPRVWDPEECECKCAEVLTCCKNGEQCGLIFMKETCECGVDASRLAIRNENMTAEQLDAYFATINGSTGATTSLSSSPSLANARAEVPIITTTLETITTAATSTTGHELCPGVNCPFGFVLQPSPNGCRCRRNMTRNRSRAAAP